MTAIDPYKNRPAPSSDPQRLVNGALDFWGDPTLTAETTKVLLAFAKAGLPQARRLGDAPSLVAGALRQLVAVSPDYQTS